MAQAAAFSCAGGKREDEMPQAARRGLHPQRAGQMQVVAERRIQRIALRVLHDYGQDGGQHGVEVSAGTEAVKAAQHDQAAAALDRLLELFQFRRLEDLGMNVAEDIDVVFPRLERFDQLDRFRLLDMVRIDADGIDLDVPRGIQRAADEFLFHAETRPRCTRRAGRP